MYTKKKKKNSKAQQVSEFKYLGNFFLEDRRLDNEIETRYKMANGSNL